MSDPFRAATVTSRVDTVLVAGSTTQTLVLPSCSSSAETGSWTPGRSPVCKRCGDRRSEAEALRRIGEGDPHPLRAGGGIGLRSDLPHGSGSPNGGIELQGDVEVGFRIEIPPDALGQIDYRLANIRAGHSDDSLPRAGPLARVRRGQR